MMPISILLVVCPLRQAANRRRSPKSHLFAVTLTGMKRTFGLLIAAAMLTLPAAASAQIANFRASLAGTYTQQGTSTDSRCWTDDGDGNGNVTYHTVTSTASETDSFHSIKPINLQVSRVILQKTVDAGSFQQLLTTYTLHRESVMGPDTPANCDPDNDPGAPTPDCGTKTKTYRIRVYGRVDKPAFSFLFSNGSNTIYPDDPFTGCRLAGGGLWPGSLETSGPAPVNPAKLFNPHVRTIVVHGVNSGTTHPEAPLTGTGTYKLSWTLTLKRVR
jgi:hypothetical protein